MKKLSFWFKKHNKKFINPKYNIRLSTKGRWRGFTICFRYFELRIRIGTRYAKR